MISLKAAPVSQPYCYALIYAFGDSRVGTINDQCEREVIGLKHKISRLEPASPT